MRNWCLAFTTLVALGIVASAPVFAQTETGAITGTVMDPTGAVVPNAKVTLKNAATNAVRSSTTSTSGNYTITNLPPAVYTLVVEAPGFSTSQRNVTVEVGSRVGVDVQLSVGQTGTTVEVVEAAATVNTETQTLGGVVNTQQIVELPTLSRNPYALIATVGNVSGATPDGRGVGYAINGQRAASTNIMLDGTANNDEFTATVGTNVPLDSVQEFSVLTNNFTAEYGRATGGIVNVVTKSGTNNFHGTAYEFNRLSKLASNSFDNNANGLPKQVFTRNQYGYSLGGPAVKDKLFFFTSTEWIKVRSQATRTVYVPTDQFIALAAPNTQSFFKTYGGLSSNVVNLGSFSKADFLARGLDVCKGQAAASKCAGIPASTPLFNRIAYGFPADSGGGFPQNTYMSVARVDYNLSEKTQMYARYSVYSEADFEGYASDSPYAGYNSPNNQFNNSVVYSLTHSFSPSFVSQTKIDFNRFNNLQPFGSKWANVPTLYLSSPSVASTILGNNVAMPGYNPYTPGSSIPFGGPQNFVQIYQDMSKITGKHQIRFGGSYNYLRDNRTFGAYQDAGEILGNNLGRGMEGFLTGQLYQFTAAVNPQGKFPCGATTTPDCTLTLPVGQPDFSRSNRYHDWALYVQDAWKVMPRLTLNLGLRWEAFGTQHNKDANKDSNFYPSDTSGLYQSIAGGSVMLAPNSPIGKLWNTRWNNFGPRVGIAWDIFGDGKTSLRGGYGRAYERNFGNVTFNVIQNPPNYASLSLLAGSDLPQIPVSVDNAGPLSGSSGSKALGKVTLRAVDPNIKNAAANLYSAALEHKFRDSIVGAIEYSGSKGLDQYGIANVNRVGAANYYLGVACTPGTDGDPGTCTARPRATQYSSINFRTNGGFASYNAMNLRLDIHGRAGLQMRFNYTWSHAIDTLSDTFSGSANQQNLGWLDPLHPELDKGDAYYDIRHRFTMAGTWDIPFHGTGALRQVVGGWALAPILTINTGSPFSLYDCTDGYNVCPYAFATKAVPVNGTGLKATATPNTYQYLNVTGYFDSSWFNPKTGISDFGPFPSNMVGRNRFRGPGAWNLDLGVYKTFFVGERYRLQFRGEGYNFFNHPNLYANTGDSDVSSIDYVSASYGGRRFVQLALKLTF